jgi:DNA (cytosine-5)-methyltransferase 1
VTRPRLLDLFCGAGGAAVGYHRAGFDVVGVDIRPQPHYPFEFIQADAIEFMADYLMHDVTRPIDFDAIHASPPCQAYSITRNLPWVDRSKHWDSIPPTLAALARARVPWVMENVEGAPVDGIMLCGQMFGLRLPDGRPVYRHRLFRTPFFTLAPAHPKHFETIQSGHQTRGRIRASADRMAIDVPWMTGDEARQAIPPAYTEWIGAQLLASLERVA